MAAAAAAAGPVYGPLGMGLSPWTHEKLIREVLTDQDTTIQWCKDIGLLARSMTCHGCRGDMRWEATTEAKVDGQVRCTSVPTLHCCHKMEVPKEELPQEEIHQAWVVVLPPPPYSSPGAHHHLPVVREFGATDHHPLGRSQQGNDCRLVQLPA